MDNRFTTLTEIFKSHAVADLIVMSAICAGALHGFSRGPVLPIMDIASSFLLVPLLHETLCLQFPDWQSMLTTYPMVSFWCLAKACNLIMPLLVSPLEQSLGLLRLGIARDRLLGLIGGVFRNLCYLSYGGYLIEENKLPRVVASFVSAYITKSDLWPEYVRPVFPWVLEQLSPYVDPSLLFA